MRMQHHGTVCAKIVQKEGDMEEQDDEDAEDPDEEEEDKDDGSTHATAVTDLAETTKPEGERAALKSSAGPFV